MLTENSLQDLKGGNMSEIAKAVPLHIQTYRFLRELILRGDFEPAERIVESRVAEKLGISRGPLREAIRMLIQDGLLVQKKNAIFIFSPDFQDVTEIYTCRQGLECLAAKLASQNITAEEQYILQNLLMESQRAFREKDTKKMIDCNTGFHETIVLASKNKQLIELFQVIQGKIVFMRNTIFRHFDRDNFFLEEHERIADAINSGDGEMAEKYMLLHILHDLEMFRQFYQKKGRHYP